MASQPETYKRVFAGLQEGFCEGRLKNRTDSILLFAELTDAVITQEEFRSVRNHLSRVLRHSRAIRRALRQGDGQITKIKGAFASKPAETLSDLRNQIGEDWIVHLETAFLKTGKGELEAETSRLREESEALKESISGYHDLLDAWNEFVRGQTSLGCSMCRRRKET